MVTLAPLKSFRNSFKTSSTLSSIRFSAPLNTSLAHSFGIYWDNIARKIRQTDVFRKHISQFRNKTSILMKVSMYGVPSLMSHDKDCWK